MIWRRWRRAVRPTRAAWARVTGWSSPEPESYSWRAPTVRSAPMTRTTGRCCGRARCPGIRAASRSATRRRAVSTWSCRRCRTPAAGEVRRLRWRQTRPAVTLRSPCPLGACRRNTEHAARREPRSQKLESTATRTSRREPDMDQVRCNWARPFVVVLLSLAGAAGAFAQGGSGTLTGTVVDATGAAIPGAAVSATEANTGSVRTVVSNEVGLFRMAALNPGGYVVSVELTGFSTLTVGDIALLTSEIRDLDRLTLQLGAITETVSVTSEVTPVQLADSARRSTITVNDLANIQMKGRDVYGLLAILPGVQDTNLNRDFAQWRSASAITINGAPTINKDLRVDGMNIVDEGGCSTGFVNLNMDAIGEVQVIANGYTAENGRNSGGLISVVTKSGTSQLKGSGWYNGRRDRFNANDYFRKVTNLPKPLYRINISGYTVGGPVVIPGIVDSRDKGGSKKKMFFFASQEYTDDARPTTTTRNNMPTALEKGGDFSQTRITSGAIQPIIDPLTGLPFPGNVIPANRISPLGQRMLNLLPNANGVLNAQPGQEWTSNSAYDLTPTHSRLNHVLRVDGVLTEKTRMSARASIADNLSITKER